MSNSAGRTVSVGKDLAVRFTKREALKAGLVEGMSVVVTAEAGRITVDVRTKPSLEQKLKGFDPARHGGEVLADAPVGAERIGASSSNLQSMRSVLGDSLLAGLLGLTPKAMLRYASGTHVMPASVRGRLEWLTKVAFDLAGGYDDRGIRRWFARPRAQLDGRSPKDVLGTRWLPKGRSAARVQALAALVSGA